MSSDPEKPKKAPRKHVTTACVPCRESKIRVCTEPPSRGDRRDLTTSSVTGLHHTVRIVNGRAKNADISMVMTSGSELDDGFIFSRASICAEGSRLFVQSMREIHSMILYSHEMCCADWSSSRVSLRAATELFSARIDQLLQFIHDQGLEPPPMKPEDEIGMSRVLDTLQIPRGVNKGGTSSDEQKPATETKAPGASTVPPAQSPANIGPNGQSQPMTTPGTSPSQGPASDQQLPSAVEPWSPFGMIRGAADNQSFVHWGFTLPTAESLDNIYANINGGPGMLVNTGMSPDDFPLGMEMAQQPRVMPGQLPPETRDHESDSDEDDEPENDVIEQLSNRIGTLKIAGDGHLRFYGATSNLNLVDVSATQQRQRPDARTVRHDGQDILNHLRVGQPVDQALEDHLVELFFTWQNPSIYVVDKEMYLTARSSWRNEYDDNPFYSEVLTNAMYVYAHWLLVHRYTD